MLRKRDIFVLARLIDEPLDWTFDSLSRDLQLSKSAIHRSIKHLSDSALVDSRNRRVRRTNAEEFLVHGLRYAFPARPGGETRGVPTAWAVAPLSTAFAPTTSLPPIWPYPTGSVRGAAVEPLDKVAPKIALTNQRLHETLAMLDALRIGDARARNVARTMLVERLSESPPK